jgi:protein-disulfide isomerase
VTTSRRTAIAVTAAALGVAAWAPRHARAQGAPPRAERTLSGADLVALNTPDEGLEERTLGPATARVTLIDYSSLTCPHCATFHNEVVPRLKERYVDSGQMRLVFRNFILNVLDAGASMMARCVPGDRFFPIIEVLFQQQRVWAAANDPVAALFNIGRQAGFTQESFERCLRDQALLDRLNAARDRAQQRFGVNSTPTLFINGQMYRGALRLEQVESIIAPMLRA